MHYFQRFVFILLKQGTTESEKNKVTFQLNIKNALFSKVHPKNFFSCWCSQPFGVFVECGACLSQFIKTLQHWFAASSRGI